MLLRRKTLFSERYDIFCTDYLFYYPIFIYHASIFENYYPKMDEIFQKWKKPTRIFLQFATRKMTNHFILATI